MKTIKVTADVEIPKVPNFLLMDNKQQISIADVTTGGLKKIGEAWTKQLVDR